MLSDENVNNATMQKNEANQHLYQFNRIFFARFSLSILFFDELNIILQYVKIIAPVEVNIFGFLNSLVMGVKSQFLSNQEEDSVNCAWFSHILHQHQQWKWHKMKACSYYLL